MIHVIEKLPKTKSIRHGRIVWTPACDDFGPAAGVLAIHTERVSATFKVEEFPCDFAGRGFYLARIGDGESYSCFVAKDGRANLCECRGAIAHGKCKHISSLVQLIGNGEL